MLIKITNESVYMVNKFYYLDDSNQKKKVRKANLIVDGNTGIYDWETLKGNWYLPKSGTSSSTGITIEQRADGRIIFCSIIGTDVYECEIEDVDTLLSMNESVINWELTGITANSYGRCHLSRADNTLWLTVLEAGSSTTNASYKLYKSPSGNGRDWVLHSTLYSHLGTGYNWNLGNYSSAGSVKALSNGRYVLCGTYISNGDWHAPYPNIWTSEDKGLTWTHRYRMSAGPSVHAYFESTFSKCIAEYNGVLYYCFSYNYGGTANVVRKSLDGGLTWGSAFNTSGVGGTMHNDLEGNLLMIHTSYSSTSLTVRKYLSPLDDGSSIVLKSLSGKSNAHNHLVTLDDRILIISGAYVLGFKFEEFKRIRNLKYNNSDVNWGGVAF